MCVLCMSYLFTNPNIDLLGVYHILQLNEAEDNDDCVTIATKHFVRSCLWFTNDCTLQGAAYCTTGYSDYVIDIYVFLEDNIDFFAQ